MAEPVKSPKRGAVYLVNFDPTVGSEIKKKRPALILQNGSHKYVMMMRDY
ncbi:type II toxin-antitoxin system PemK/MazF family toxin [Oscillatoria sp. HE19RPO]